MAGISSKAAGEVANKNKFGRKELQSAEFSDGSGLEQYDFGSRNYDPQVGRWMNIDAFAEKAYSLTPYRYCFNNPMLFVDPDGRWELRLDTEKDKDGNSRFVLKLVAEKDDNIGTLATQTGIKQKKLEKMGLKGSEINEKSVITGGMGKLLDFDRINQALNYTQEQCKDQNNCWNMTFEYSEGKSIATDGSYSSTNGLAAFSLLADTYLKDASNGYQNVKEKDGPQSGDIMRFSNGCFYVSNNDAENTYTCLPVAPTKPGATSHYAIFLLKNNHGTQVFTKNGSSADTYRVQYTSEKVSAKSDQTMIQAYGNPVGVGDDKTAYYRKN